MFNDDFNKKLNDSLNNLEQKVAKDIENRKSEVLDLLKKTDKINTRTDSMENIRTNIQDIKNIATGKIDEINRLINNGYSNDTKDTIKESLSDLILEYKKVINILDIKRNELITRLSLERTEKK